MSGYAPLPPAVQSQDARTRWDIPFPRTTSALPEDADLLFGYCAIVDTLIDAGAEYQAAVNRWQEPPQGMASGRVRARIVARGFAPKS
jgi:hypothetical protein